MKIGIDISQLAHEKTGVASYLKNLVQNLLDVDSENEYVLFYSSLRIKYNNSLRLNSRTTVRTFKLPPTLLDILWNKLHLMPIESFIGDVDVFVTSDWAEPPVKRAKKVTILYDLIVYKYPNETDAKIRGVQKTKLNWVKSESERIICISEATKKDAKEILEVDEAKLAVTYPGV